MDLVSGSILGKVWSAVQPFVTARFIAAIKGSPVDRAIDGVDSEFPQFGGVREALRTWSTSNEFLALQERFKQGERALISDDVVQTFMALTGFELPEDTRSEVRRLLHLFLEKLEREYLHDEDAHVIQAARTESLMREAKEVIADIATQQQELLVIAREQRTRVTLETSSEAAQTSDPGLDQARALLLAGKFEAARILLQAARVRVDGDTPAAVQFRIALNLGVCALHRGDLDEARREFLMANRLSRNEPKALVNLASLALLQGENEKAVTYSRKAAALAPDDPETAAVHVRALHTVGRARALTRYVARHEELLTGSAAGLVALAEGKYDDRDFTAAAALYRRSLELDPGDHSGYLGLAATLASDVQQSLQSDPPLLSKVPEHAKLQLDEADLAYSRALEIVEHRDLPLALRAILVSRSAVRAMRLDLQGSLADIERAATIGTLDGLGLANKGRTLLAMGRYHEAVAAFGQIADPDVRRDTEFASAEAYRALGQFTEARERLESLLRDEHFESIRIEVAESLIETYASLHQEQSALELAAEFERRYPANPEAFALRARWHSLAKEYDQAATILDALVDATSDRQRDRLNLLLANIEFARNNFARAAELYGPLVDPAGRGPLVRKYLAALYRAGRLGDALTLARQMKDVAGDSAFAIEVEAACLEEIGDLRGAGDLVHELIQRFPDRPEHRIQAAQLAAKLGDTAELGRLVDSIDARSIWDDPQALLSLARLEALLSRDQVSVELAFRALRLAREDPEVHLTFAALMLNADQPTEHQVGPSAVAVGTTVSLKRSEQSRTYTILADQPYRRDRGELSPDDPVAVILLGKRTGDSVVLGNDTLEVSAIRLAHVAAIQDTFNRFTTVFPVHGGLKSVPVPEDDPLSEIRPMLEEQERLVSQGLELYHTGILPLAGLGRFTGRSVLTTWSGLAGDPDERLLVSGGANGDLRKQVEVLETHESIVLDLSAACTLAMLNLETVFSSTHVILTTQSTVDAVREELTRIETSRASGTLGIRDGKFFYHEVSAEGAREWGAFLSRLFAFVTSLKVVPVRAALELGRETFHQLAHVAGSSGAGTSLVAAERRALLLADDLGLRTFAFQQLGVQSVWTQAILLQMLQAETIDEAQYAAALGKLAAARYHFLSVRSEDIIRAADEAGPQPSQELLVLLRTIEGPDCTPESAALLVAELARHLWTQALPDARRSAVLDQSLVNLTRNRPASQVLRRLNTALQRRFGLIPQQLEQVTMRIAQWQMQRPLNVSDL